MHAQPVTSLSSSDFAGAIFDLDGVVTQTARVHAAAWKQLFDDYLLIRSKREGSEFHPFDKVGDYRNYVDGKPRYEGVADFLESRGIRLPYGDPEDGEDQETVCGLGNRKNRLFLEFLQREGVEVYSSTIEWIRTLSAQGVKTAVVTASKNCAAVLSAAGIADLFETGVDGVEAERMGLRGKPRPDTFLEAARRLGVDPARAIIVEDAIAGVQAGREGGFGCVIGIDRAGQAQALKANGARIVVRDLAEVKLITESSRKASELPSALGLIPRFQSQGAALKLAFFLDYDGTLTPIVDTPERAILSEAMRSTLRDLARVSSVAVISGRDLRDVARLVGLREITYAGSHGFEISGPGGLKMEERGAEFLPVLEEAERELRQQLAGIAGALVERKRFSVAVHYRNVEKRKLRTVARVVDDVSARHSRLRQTQGKKVYDLQPDIPWNKGEAVRWLLSKLGLDRPGILPMYIGDDVTDEDAFRELSHRGVTILVRDDSGRETYAQYALQGVPQVRGFLDSLAQILKESVA